MIYLVLSVVASCIIFMVFKLYEKFNITILQAIITNYIIACSSGLIAYGKPIPFSSLPTFEWFPGAVTLGFIFISVFTCMAITTQRNGLSVVAVASKMSVAVPILFGIIMYKEATGLWKVAGMLLALVAVYLTSVKNKDGLMIDRKNLIFPVLVFIGSGVIDTSLKYLETNYVEVSDISLFSATIFGCAALIGVVILLFKHFQGTLQLQLKNIFAGIALGIPNYFSVFFLIKALRHAGMDSSTTFTVNNVAILVVSTLLGILIFKEKLIPKNWVGLALAIISLFMVTAAV